MIMEASGETRLIETTGHISPKRTLTRNLMKCIHPVEWEQRDLQRHPAGYSTGGQQKIKIATFTPWNSNRPGAEKKRGLIPLRNNRYLESRNNFSFLLSRFLLSAFAFAFCFLLSQFLLLPSFAQPKVTPAQYLQMQQKPNFAAGHHLPHLTRWGWCLSTNADIELANNWDYCLEFENYVTYSLATHLDAYNTTVLKLVSNNPAIYKLSVLLDQTFTNPPTDFYCTNSSGQFVSNGLNHLCVSPEGTDAYWSNSADYWIRGLKIIQSNALITTILNGGEAGIDVPGFGEVAWLQDPRVQAATNGMDIYRYSSNRKAWSMGFLTRAIAKQIPNRELSIFYETGYEETRDCYGGSTNAYLKWGWNSDVMVTNTDLPSFEIYYSDVGGNGAWTNNSALNYGNPYYCDLLTRVLDAVGYNITLGHPLNYSWINGGSGTNVTDFSNLTKYSDIPTYTGFLKCLYTSGMVGGIAGYFDYPVGGFDTSFQSNNPPHWLLQMMALAHTHALFSHLEPFLTNGDLLSGPQVHVMSTDQPAYEFTNTVNDIYARVLARKLRTGNQWLVTAWNAYGTNRNVTVSIPTLGALTVLAAASGSVYQVTTSGTNVQQTLLDESASFSTSPPSNLRVLPGSTN
jgi:hypothetical protein